MDDKQQMCSLLVQPFSLSSFVSSSFRVFVILFSTSSHGIALRQWAS
jgi:hypothetical protein